MTILDRALAGIRNTIIPAEQVEQAASRVKARLQAEQNKVVLHPAVVDAHEVDRIRGCGDFQALIPAYLTSSLVVSRRLLLEDHTHECVVCRKALEAARSGGIPSFAKPRRQPARRHFPLRALIAAAGLAMLAIGLIQTDIIRDVLWPIDVHAMARSVDGNLYSLSGQDVKPIMVGERIGRRQSVRTGMGSQAVLELADGSRIEMSERTELTLNRARDGVRVELARGNVIVTAAHQRNGHLYVATADSTTTVIGTVFAVNAGTKGSRVSVIQGEVQVEHGGNANTVRAGQQVTTNPGLDTVPVAQQIAWSRDQERYLALLREYVAASQDFDRRIGGIEMRYTSKLVPLLPEDTAVFISLPNVGQSLEASYAIFKQRVAENTVLNEWWRQSSSNRLVLDEMVKWVGEVARDLGSEIVLALPKNPDRSAPLLLAEAMSPSGLASTIQGSRAESHPNGFFIRDGVKVEFFSAQNPRRYLARDAAELSAAAANPGQALTAYIDQGLLAVSTSATQIQRAMTFVKQPAANRFAGTRLYARLAQAYREGVGWLLAADLQRLTGSQDPRDAAHFEQLGLADAQELVVEQKTGSAGASFQATLGFSQNRKGMASWLSAPSSMGALEFVSPNAYAVAGVVTKDPLLILEDVFSILRTEGDAWQKLQEYQQQNHLDLRYDFAGTLGNEFLFALDGPLLPAPSWKVIIEVNDGARLQNALQSSVNVINTEAAVNQKPGINLRTESSAGLTFYSMTSSEFKTEIHYTFWMGYLIIAPSRALLMDAMQYRNTGTSLARSERFRSELPADGRDEVSGVVYQNIKAIADALPGNAAPETVIAGALPTLICLYGHPDRILLSSKGVLGANIASAAGLGHLMDTIHGR